VPARTVLIVLDNLRIREFGHMLVYTFTAKWTGHGKEAKTTNLTMNQSDKSHGESNNEKQWARQFIKA
jgi:hypothetical protein